MEPLGLGFDHSRFTIPSAKPSERSFQEEGLTETLKSWFNAA